MSSFCVANLRNSWLLRAKSALILNILGTIYFAQNKSEVPYIFSLSYLKVWFVQTFSGT
jgi:hypothetical protein